MKRYLPKIYRFKQVYLVDDIEGWKSIEGYFPDSITCRIDTKIGNTPITNVRGQTFHKANVERYIQIMQQEASKINSHGTVLCIESVEKSDGERIYTDGGFNIYVELGREIDIDWVGKGFDSKELTQGEASHQTWSIPWEDTLFVKPEKIQSYEARRIDQKNYQETSQKRMNFLLESAKKFPNNPEYAQEKIEKYLPKEYMSIPTRIMESLLDKVILPIYTQQEKLRRCEGLTRFSIQGNIVEGRIIPFELALPQRHIKKETKLKEEER